MSGSDLTCSLSPSSGYISDKSAVYSSSHSSVGMSDKFTVFISSSWKNMLSIAFVPVPLFGAPATKT